MRAQPSPPGSTFCRLNFTRSASTSISETSHPAAIHANACDLLPVFWLAHQFESGAPPAADERVRPLRSPRCETGDPLSRQELSEDASPEADTFLRRATFRARPPER